jgi:HD-like signal output (HDOD) protein
MPIFRFDPHHPPSATATARLNAHRNLCGDVWFPEVLSAAARVEKDRRLGGGTSRELQMFLGSLSARMALATGNFAKLFGKVEIPPLSSVATRLMAICRKPDCDVSEISGLIASDVGISSRILRTVNSPNHGLRYKVTSIQQAISLLGLKRISSLVTAFAVARRIPDNAPGFDRVAFWQSSVQRSVFAEHLAGVMARGAEAEAFTGALLQDLALPILLEQWSPHYAQIVRIAETFGRPLHKVEDEELSWNHAQAGAWIARHWGLPDVLVCCIGLHHATLPEIASLGFLHSPIAAVVVSSQLPEAGAVCSRELSMDSRDYDRLCRATDTACAALSSVFNIPTPAPLNQA